MNALTLPVVSSVERSFDILLSRRAEVEAGLTALAKRFARKGFAPIVFSFRSRVHVG